MLPFPSHPRLEQYEHRAEERSRGGAVTLDGARLGIANEHGFASWPQFARQVEALAREDSPESQFEAAADAIITGDAETLARLLRERPELALQRSGRQHHSTLLHYISANGVEDFRQKTPPNILHIAAMLLDAGADVNAESEAYGGGATTLSLVATSIHPERAGRQEPLLQALLDRGARIDRAVVFACLANGQPRAAGFLASVGAPLDLPGAAGLGRLDLVRAQFEAASPEQRGWALLLACGFGHQEVAASLLDGGVDPGWQNQNGQTALHWAVYCGRPGAVELLIERGAPVHVRDKLHSATPLEVALGRPEPGRSARIIALLENAA